MQVPRITLVLGPGAEAGDTAPLVVGVEFQREAMGLPMPQTKHMRELGCFSMMLSPCAACMIASTQGLGKRL
jgi:hypothetical protein